MDEIAENLPILIAGLLLMLAVLIVADSARRGLNRADAGLAAIRQQVAYTISRTEEMQRSVREQDSTIAEMERKAALRRNENDALAASLAVRELRFDYTVVPSDSGDMYGAVAHFIVRHPTMGNDAAADHPAAAWASGRRYAIASPSQSDAREMLDRILSRSRGFDVVAVGAVVGRAPGTA